MSMPALRFKGFEGVWKNRLLSEIVGRLESGVSVNSEDSPISNSHEYGILKTSCIADGYFLEHENKKIIAADIARAKLNPNMDTILVSRMNTPLLVGEVGYISKNYPNLFVPDRLWLIEVKNKSRDSTKWLSQQLTTKKLKSTLTNIASGTSGSMKNIAQPNFLKIGLSTPEFDEQRKIANFLTAIDEKISVLTQKHDLLTQYKTGVMQQIFSQELRFKDEDGQDFPEWEDAFLGDICKITTGVSNRIDSSVDGGAYTFFDRSQDIRTSDIFLFDCEAVIVAGEGQEFIPKHFAGKFDLHQRTYAIMGFEKIQGKFLFYYVHQFRNYFLSQAVGSTVKSLRLPMFQKMPIHYLHVNEQTKIANFLTAIDDKISTTQTQLKAVKQYKQGLLQQMFV